MTDTVIRVFALLAESAPCDPLGIASINNLIRGVTVTSLPTTFTWALPFWFWGTPGAIVPVQVEVRSHMGRPLFFDSGKTIVPSGGEGEFVVKLGPVVVDAVGPLQLSLTVGSGEWSRPIFVGLSDQK